MNGRFTIFWTMFTVTMWHHTTLYSKPHDLAPAKKASFKKTISQKPKVPPKSRPTVLTGPFILQDGTTVVKAGVFLPGCAYGANASISDHAPVIWENDDVGTWNITSRVSHQPLTTGQEIFLGHKFKTDEHGVLVNEKNQPAIKGHRSEANILAKKTVTNEHYVIRLKRIAKEIKSLFQNYRFKFLAIQEIPYAKQRDVEGTDIQKAFAEALGPDFVVHYPEPSRVIFSRAQSEKPLDVALVTPRHVRIKLYPADLTNRMQPYCHWATKSCVASIHMPFTSDEEKLKKGCQIMVRNVEKLFAAGFDRVNVVGDFNASAVKIYRSCKDVFGFTPVIKVSPQSPQSCSTNDGTPSPVTIDLLLVFTKPQK